MAPKSDPKPSGSSAPAPSASAAAASSSAASSAALRASATPAPGARPAQSMVPSRGRGTGTKLLFRPVIPQRRKPTEPSVKPETSAASSSSSAATSSAPRGRGTGRGGARGRGDARGRGRGGPPGRSASFAPVEMIATGPFAQGSGALSRSSGSRGGTSLSAAPSWAAGPTVKTDTAARSAYRDPDKLKEREEYSDTENDVEIIDMDEVHTLDEMAPRAPPRMREKEEKRKAKERTKKAQKAKEAGEKRAARTLVKDDPEPVPGSSTMDLDDDDDDEKMEDDDKDEARGADALDLSASEDEEVMDDLLDDFLPVDEDDGPSPENRLYLFQFPTLFPKFTAASSGTGEPSSEASDGAAGASGKARRSVAFTEDAIAAKNKDGSSKEVKKESGEAGDAGRQRPEGQAGRLELYKDGRVAMRFGDVVMEVTGASQATFLQQVMVLDAGGGGSSSSGKKRAVVLGELVRKFVVSPELEGLLHDAGLADAEAKPSTEGEDTNKLD